jgi:hypothetical protein
LAYNLKSASIDDEYFLEHFHVHEFIKLSFLPLADFIKASLFNVHYAAKTLTWLGFIYSAKNMNEMIV